MEKIKHESTEYARIDGVGLIRLADPGARMTLNQSINAKSYQRGLPTKYFRVIKERDYYVSITEYCRCFLSMCDIRIQEFKEMPNHSGYLQPSCF